ncbi:MAG: molybdopterin-dependent oxidoreductase [Actinomycetota bacterium]
MTAVLDLVPRRAAGLPPGQREVRAFPRFSDAPLRWAPPPSSISLEISIDGRVERTLDSDDLAGFPPVEQTSDFHCVTTWTHRGLRWGGVRFADVVEEVLGSDLPPFLVATAADKVSAIYVTEDLAGPEVLLATHLDGQPLDARHGAPLRLVSPGQYGYKNPKHLIGLDFRSTEPTSTLGKKEHLRARVDREERHSTLPNWAVRVPYRLAIIPTALAAERGLRTSPR